MIPAMTHPLSSAWDQPALHEIELDETHALMTEATFKRLHDYSLSVPTAVYDGKMWRCRDRANGRWLSRWFLCWYGPTDDPDMCATNSREILIA